MIKCITLYFLSDNESNIPHLGMDISLLQCIGPSVLWNDVTAKYV